MIRVDDRKIYYLLMTGGKNQIIIQKNYPYPFFFFRVLPSHSPLAKDDKSQKKLCNVHNNLIILATDRIYYNLIMNLAPLKLVKVC